MDLDAGHPLGHGSRLIVGQAERGDTDQDQLALEQMRLDGPGENVGSRHEARWIVSSKVHPDASIGLGGDEEIADAHGLETRDADAHREDRRSGGHAEYLDAEPREHDVGRGGDERHAADHATLGLHVQETVAPRDTVDLLDTAERPFEAWYEELRVTADGAHRSLADRPASPARVPAEARDAQHDGPSTERLGQDHVVARKAGEPLDQVLAHSRDKFRQAVR